MTNNTEKPKRTKWYSTFNHPDGLFFIIKEDAPEAGFFLYVYSDRDSFEEDIWQLYGCSQHEQDHLQDTFEIARRQAREDFGVPEDSWVEVTHALREERAP